MSTTSYENNSIMAYVGAAADVVGVSGTVVLPDWEGSKVYFLQTNEFSSPGVRQFDIDAAGDETLQKSMATLGTTHLYAGPTGGAASISYDGAYITFISDTGNTSEMCKVRASDLTVLARTGAAGAGVNPASLIAPYHATAVLNTASFFVASTGLNIGAIHNDVYSIPIDTTFLATRVFSPDELGSGSSLLSRNALAGGPVFVLGVPSTTTAALGLYSFAPNTGTHTKIGTITVAAIDATWTHITAVVGLAYDETDGHVLIGVTTSDAVSNQHYVVKLNHTTAAVVWKCAVNALTAYAQSFTHSRIRHSRFHLAGNSARVYHINTTDGTETHETFTGLTPSGPQVSDDVTNSIILYGSFSPGGSPPDYLGTYMDTGGTHTLSNAWMRVFFATVPVTPTAPGDIGGQALSVQRAWTYTLDGHTFYVLDLGTEGTFVYDLTTGQWAKFITDGYTRWNVQNGVMWGNRVVGGAIDSEDVWEVSATALTDQDGDLQITHLVTGGLQTRSRLKVGVGALRLTGSVGNLGNIAGSTMRMRFSDNNGRTWSRYFDVTLTQGDYDGEIAWRSLGAFAAPGRVFELSDVGGPVRVDGVDAETDVDNAPDGGG